VGKVPRRGALFNLHAKMLYGTTMSPNRQNANISRKAIIGMGFVMMMLVGAAIAGWLDHGVEIFATMASSAWALCF
jgi:hypothetical protein